MARMHVAKIGASTMSKENKVVIEYDGVKRDLAVPFQMCVGRETLELIASAINTRLQEMEPPHTYGWLEVVERPISTPNDAPIAWKQGAP